MKNRNQQLQENENLMDDLHEIANWIHSGIVLPLEAMNVWVRQGNYTKAKGMLPDLIHQSHSVLNELRNIQTNISGSREFETDDFSTELAELVRVWEDRVGIPGPGLIELNCPNDINPMELIKRTLLFITSEAISNALKHSGILINPEMKININVTTKANSLALEIYDNGYGTKEKKEGYGILLITPGKFVFPVL